MTEENEHLNKLKTAREAAVLARRQLADALASDYKRGHTENMRSGFIETQALIEAIDKALDDEMAIGKKPMQISDEVLERARRGGI